ncbi:MAG: type II toxin-antitoxin system RelB/DinJ family antitoxin [Fusobacterium sp.]|uniref:type II toxin-antitoxin system RelB/DinJ family antitoxin n=1 Tax=Fusobacterium sp. TaxID=68766 RepID=UPI0026DD7703|nr:type II toxin-antitoxin system RelB/DinJ family antitoxin [Fusobacterium sp.]MDO4690259.1 type II toxin-antitoxin system RelB/DinJ family antitoxin [Fusobacterium sp.]
MAIINIRVNEDIKKEAENIYKEIGLNMSTAINLFLRKCILEQGIPFDLKLPNKDTLEAIEETEKILNEEIKRPVYSNVDDLFEELNKNV